MSPWQEQVVRIPLGIALLGLVIALSVSGCTPNPACTNPANDTVAENCKAGAPASEWDVQGEGDPSIQGFATDISVNRGERVDFKVKTDAADYRLDIYRLGYYAGNGARRVATVQPSAPLPQTQPGCANNASTGLIDCGNWAVSASWQVPATAVSGIYLAKLVRESGPPGASHVVFIVRDDDGASDVLFQTSDTTWQAYNRYGGNSLYSGGPGTNPGRAYKVSYNRPFRTRQTEPEDWLFNSEYPMVRWLERNGYDVSYSTGVDSDRRGAELLEHKSFLSVGHDEYWSRGQRDNVRAIPYSYIEAAISDGSAIDFVPNTPATYTATASVTLDVGKPVLAAPASIAGSAASGTRANVTLALGNTGDRALDWTLDQGTRATAGTSTPAYIARMLLEDYPTLDNAIVGFDATAPAPPTPVASVHAIFDAGTFVDEDFSTEYVVSGWHEVGGTTIFTKYELDRVDIATGEVTRVGDTGVGPYELIQGMAWDPVTATFYAIITAVDGSGTTLATIDRYDGHVTRLMPITGIDLPMLLGLAIDGDGAFFSIDQNTASLVRIDGETGFATVAGPIGDEVTLLLNGPLAFDRMHNVLYMIGATEEFLAGEYVVDLVSGHAGLLGTVGTDPQLASALALADAGGPCSNATPASWLSFDPDAGTVAPGDTASIAVTLDANGLAEGRYEADLCVRSNDPYRHNVPVHVTFDVGPDTLFADGFDVE